MKKKFTNTKVTVKLRKSENEDLWYLYLESYPVFENGKDTPVRKREYINRSIRTPKWDKSHTARTTENSQSFKPLRDLNGVILCKSDLDRDACIYADELRKIRQKEYDNANLYSDKEKEMKELQEKAKMNFTRYFSKLITERHSRSSESIIVNWKRVLELLKIFSKDEDITFSQINSEFIERFRHFMLSAPCGGGKSGTISINTASTYFSIFLAALKQAFVDGYFTVDIAAKTKGIKGEERRREHLTMDELNRLAATDCDMPILKRASLFSALTGLRLSDIQKLKWSEVQQVDGKYRLNFTQQKTKGVEYMPISEQAYQLCGERLDPDRLVFEDLPDSAWISNPLKRWIFKAGITRKITFHCFRHTYATLQLANGTDIYTVSKMLGHTNVQTTQIYAKVVDEKKEQAANNIKLDGLNDLDQQQ